MASNQIKRMSDKQKFSLAVRTLSDKGFNNEDIADLMGVSRPKVGAVMAWHRHRDSWVGLTPEFRPQP